MLRDYWEVKYKECPECGKKQQSYQLTAYFQCKYDDCDYKEKDYLIANKREKEVRGVIEEIIKYLLNNDEEYSGTIPTINWPEMALIEGDICAGWYFPPTHTISIPRKTFYLPNSDIVEVASHETAHVPCEPFIPDDDATGGHIEKWHYKYMDYRKKAFAKFSSFANQKNPESWFSINQTKEKYKKQYGYDLEDLKYNPNED